MHSSSPSVALLRFSLIDAYPQSLGLVLAGGGSLSCSGLVLVGGDPPSLLGLISTGGGSLPVIFGLILTGGGLVLEIGDSAGGGSRRLVELALSSLTVPFRCVVVSPLNSHIPASAHLTVVGASPVSVGLPCSRWCLLHFCTSCCCLSIPVMQKQYEISRRKQRKIKNIHMA